MAWSTPPWTEALVIAYIAEAITILSQNRYKKRLDCSTFHDRLHVIRELLKDKICLTMGGDRGGYPPITFGMNEWLNPAILEDMVLLRLAPKGLLFIIASWHEHKSKMPGRRLKIRPFLRALRSTTANQDYVQTTENPIPLDLLPDMRTTTKRFEKIKREAAIYEAELGKAQGNLQLANAQQAQRILEEDNEWLRERQTAMSAEIRLLHGLIKARPCKEKSCSAGAMDHDGEMFFPPVEARSAKRDYSGTSPSSSLVAKARRVADDG